MTDYVWHNENYDKRIQLTIDSSKVSSGLVDFPVLIHLSNLSGITSADVISVFDELTSSGVLYDNTWNPNDKAAGITLTYNNLTAEWIGGSSWDAVRSTLSRSSGKWYWEVKVDASGDTNFMIGIGTHLETLTYPGDTTAGYGYYGANGNKYHDTAAGYGVSYTTNDIIGVALDLDNGKIWWAKNNAWQASGNPASGTNPAYTGVVGEFYAMIGLLVAGNRIIANFGASSFTYTPPTGFEPGFSSAIPNDKKIAVYTTSGTQDVQCYTEIEKWVTTSGSEEAWMWIKVPTISGAVDTQLYLYYGKDAPDNTSYIGDTNSFPASQVWTNDFELVYHMGNGASKTTVYDSTLNSYDGTKTVYNRPVEIDGKIGDAQSYLDAGEGRIQTANNTFKETNNFTVEALINPDVISNNRGIVYRGNGSTHNFMCTIHTGGYIQWWSSAWAQSTNALVNVGTWQQLAWVKSGAIVEYFYNGAKDSQDAVTTPSYTTTVPTNVGWWSSSYDYDGDIDEVRLSSCVRSPAWLETTYYSNFDNLITFGSEELKPSFVFNGYVQVMGSPAERTVYLYHRSTGALVGTATSNGTTGYFEIPTPFNDYHFVNILPELSEEYNILVEDKIEQGS